MERFIAFYSKCFNRVICLDEREAIRLGDNDLNTFKLKIIGSNKTFFNGECASLTLPIADGGQMGFLAHHENTVAPLDSGEMIIKTADNEIIEAFVSGGFIEFFDNVAYVVCISVETPEEIDSKRAEEARARAEEALRQKHSIYEYYQSKNDLARAMERLKIKNRHEI